MTTEPVQGQDTSEGARGLPHTPDGIVASLHNGVWFVRHDDEWLAQHVERALAAERERVLLEAADELPKMSHWGCRKWLRDRAAIARGNPDREGS